MLGARASLRFSKNPRSLGIGKAGSFPKTTSYGGLSGPAARSLATHSVVMPVTISTLTPCFFSNGSTSAFFITSSQRPPYPVTTRVVFCWAAAGGAWTRAAARTATRARIRRERMRGPPKKLWQRGFGGEVLVSACLTNPDDYQGLDLTPPPARCIWARDDSNAMAAGQGSGHARPAHAPHGRVAGSRPGSAGHRDGAHEAAARPDRRRHPCPRARDTHREIRGQRAVTHDQGDREPERAQPAGHALPQPRLRQYHRQPGQPLAERPHVSRFPGLPADRQPHRPVDVSRRHALQRRV